MGYNYCGGCGTKDWGIFENLCCDIACEGEICDDCYEHTVRKTCKCGKNFCANHGDHDNTDCCGRFLCEYCLDENDHPDPYGKEGGCTDCAVKQQNDDVEDALKLHDKPFVTRLLKKCKSASLQECLQDWLETVPSQPLKRRIDYDDSDDDDIIVIDNAGDDDNGDGDEEDENVDMEEDENDIADSIDGTKKKKSTENKKKLLPSSKKAAPKKKKAATKTAPKKKKPVTKTALPKKKKAATKPATPKKKKAATKTVPKKKKPTKKSTGSQLAVGAEEDAFQPPAHIRKFFPGHGWFTERVSTTTVGDEMDRYVLHFDDDDEHEEISQQELRQLMEKAAIPIGAIGYEFVREYDGVFYSGKVVTININDRECSLSDGLNHDYTLDQLEEWDTLQNNNNSATCFTSNGNVNESNNVDNAAEATLSSSRIANKKTRKSNSYDASTTTSSSRTKTLPKQTKARVSSAKDELLFKPPSQVRKFFSGYGWFTGRVTTTASTRFDKQYTIQYEDNDHEECSQQQLQHLIKEASMNVGDIGYQFVREYDGVFYSGKVKSIHGDDGIRECDVSDGEKHDYTLDQLQEWRELQNDDASKVKKW